MDRQHLQQNISHDIVPVHGGNEMWVTFMNELVDVGEFEIISNTIQREEILKLLYAEYWKEQTDVLVLYKVTEKGKTMLDFYEL